MNRSVAITLLGIVIATCTCCTNAHLVNEIFNPHPTELSLLNEIFQTENSPLKSCGVDRECLPRNICTAEEVTKIGIHECKDLEVCCESTKVVQQIILPKTSIQSGGCGYRNTVAGVGVRTVGRKNVAEFGEFPWMVGILEEHYKDETTIVLDYAGGGSLIAPNAILTAAHKVFNKTANSFIVRAGEWDTQATTEILPHQDRHVREIIIHENYGRNNFHNDIALLILDTPFQLAEHIQPICLPESDANFDNARCYATGWGQGAFAVNGTFQVILKKIDLPMIPNDQCQRNFRQTRLGRLFVLDKSFVCAGGEKDKYACDGDGGSALVCPVPGVKDRYYQVGIVAWGLTCGEENVPTAYVSIPHLRTWINEKLSSRAIDFQHFTF